MSVRVGGRLAVYNSRNGRRGMRGGGAAGKLDEGGPSQFLPPSPVGGGGVVLNIEGGGLKYHETTEQTHLCEK